MNRRGDGVLGRCLLLGGWSAVIAVVAVGPPSAAQTLVQFCDDTLPPNGVSIAGTVSFHVRMERDPATASEVTLRFTAFDSDRAGEVAIALRAPSGAVVPMDTLDNFNWDQMLDADNRKATYVTVVPAAAFGVGDNVIEVTDVDTGSPFVMHRLCIGLEGPAAAPSPPPLERFCARLRAPSATNNNGTATYLPLAEGQISTVPITADRDLRMAPMGFEAVAYTPASGLRSLTVRAGGNSQSQAFQAVGSDDHYIITTRTDGPSLLTGADAGVGGTVTALQVTPSFADKLWELCMVVPASVGPVADAGVAVPDAGPPDVAPPDAGAPPVEPHDAGPSDAGPPHEDTPDAGAPGPVPADAGQPRVDAGPPGGGGEGQVDGGPPDAAARDAGQGPVPDDPDDASMVVEGGCGAAPLGAPLAGLALLALRRRRRAA